MITLLELREQAYITASSKQRFQWAYRDALGARQVDNWLRSKGKFDISEAFEPKAMFDVFQIRDRAKADNLDWIVEQEGADGKILVFAAITHVSKSYFRIGDYPKEIMPFGMHLKKRHGDDLVAFGHVVGNGSFGCGTSIEVTPAAYPSVEFVSSSFDTPSFLLDIRNAPGSATDWLNKDHKV